MVITVDIGGTKTLVASFSGHELVREDRFATSKDVQDFLSDLIPMLDAHAGKHVIEAISIAVPGVVDHHTGSIVRLGNLAWQNIPMRQLLRDEGYDYPIYLENDANLAALGEARVLEPIPGLCLYVTVSTGIGIGLIVNGKILPALSNTEAGHMTLRWGKDYVEWEHLASGKALVERTGLMASQLRDEALWRDHAERVAEGLSVLIPALQPSVIVIGGGVGAYLDRCWRRPLEETLRKRIPPFFPELPIILQAQHPDKAVIYGCKAYAEQHLHLS